MARFGFVTDGIFAVIERLPWFLSGMALLISQLHESCHFGVLVPTGFCSFCSFS